MLSDKNIRLECTSSDDNSSFDLSHIIAVRFQFLAQVKQHEDDNDIGKVVIYPNFTGDGTLSENNARDTDCSLEEIKKIFEKSNLSLIPMLNKADEEVLVNPKYQETVKPNLMPI